MIETISKIKLHGSYRATVERDGEIIGDTDWFDNVITDYGLENLACFDNIGGHLMRHVRVGTGTSTPNFTNVKLDAQIAFTSDTSPLTSINLGSPTFGCENVLIGRFAQGAATRIFNLRGQSAVARTDYTAGKAGAHFSLLADGNNNDGSGGVWYCKSVLRLMQGVPPTNFSSLVSYNTRLSDVLVEFTPSQITVPLDSQLLPYTVTTEYVTSTKNGITTWFWWLNTPIHVSVAFDGNMLPVHQIIGTAGITGSGSDLEIPDNEIISGQPYRISNLRLLMPSSWEI